VGVATDAAAGEEQIVGEEAVVAERAHKQMAHDLQTREERRRVMSLEKRPHLRQRPLVLWIIMPASTVKPLRLVIGLRILRIMQLQQ
jgi:hypothetical protein